MRKMVVFALVGCLMLAAIPVAALAGNPHAVRNRWAGVAIGASVVTLGGLLLGALSGPVPVVAAVPPPPLPVMYAPPPPPPVVYYTPSPVVYAPSPVVVYKPWGPPGHWKQRGHGHWKHRHGWDH